MSSIDKSDWIARYITRHMALAPKAPGGMLVQIAETYWFYLRHRAPEDVAEERVAGAVPVPSRARSWIEACTEALRALDPYMGSGDAHALAERLWDADPQRVVDPYVMANALWEQALLMSRTDADGVDDLWELLRAHRPKH